jgi:ATP-dependent DNA helicase RecG
MNLGFETEQIEYKESTGEIREAMISISAMLNKHRNGTVYFGVTNKGKVVGQQVGESTTRDISRKIYEQVKPVPNFTVEVEERDGKTVIKVAFDGEETPYAADGRYYIRVSDEDRAITQAQLFDLVHEKIKTYEKWEDTLTHYTADDIDEQLLKECYADGLTVKRLSEPYTDKETVLTKLNLLVDGKLTNAGNVLFSKNKPLLLKLALYATDERRTLLDQEHFRGNIFECIKSGRLFVNSHMRWRAKIGAEVREDIPEVPVDAIREIVINSFAHARYSQIVSAHEIDITPSVVSIFNPGNLPVSVDPAEYAKGAKKSILKNPTIAEVLYLVNRIEQFGTGFRNVFALCGEAGVKINYVDDEQGFTFNFSRELINALEIGEAERELAATDYEVYKILRADGTISAENVAVKLGKSPRTVYRVFDILKAKGFIERVGGKFGGRWVVLK